MKEEGGRFSLASAKNRASLTIQCRVSDPILVPLQWRFGHASEHSRAGGARTHRAWPDRIRGGIGSHQGRKRRSCAKFRERRDLLVLSRPPGHPTRVEFRRREAGQESRRSDSTAYVPVVSFDRHDPIAWQREGTFVVY